MRRLFGGKLFYGWVIVAAMFAINFSTMATGNLNFGLFVIPMGNALGMTRAEFGWALTARRLASGATSYFVGRILDRYGPRVFIVISGIVVGVCLLLISRVTAGWQFILIFGVMGLSGIAAPNSLATSVPVAKWFRRRRGRALAIATTGLGIGGIIFLPVTQQFIEHLGWRMSWVVQAFIFMAIAIPVAAIFLRRQPEDMGLTVDGEPRVAAGEARPLAPEAVWTLQEALRTPQLWLLMAVFGMAGLAQGGGSVHRIPYWEEQGVSSYLVAWSFAADAAGAATMALISGYLADRFPIRYVAAGSYLGFVAALGLMLYVLSPFGMFSSNIIWGLAVGAGMVVQSYIFAEYYGRAFLGSIRGLVMPVLLVTNGIGAPLSGYLRDFTGSYFSSWWIMVFLYVACAALMLTIRPPQQKAAATPVQVAAA